MKTMKKIVAILAAVLMLCSILPLSVMAADETITVTGTTGVLDGTTSISWTGTGYKVVNYKNTSSTAIRTSDSAHFRAYVGNQFTVSGVNGELMSQVVINCVSSSYLINNSANTVSDGWTVSASGTAVTYTATSGSASELVITIGKQSRVTSVVITPAVAGGADCDHASLVCGDTCPECGEYTKEHAYSSACVAECERGCGTANPDYVAGHSYTGTYDATCNICNAIREVAFPEDGSELTIAQIIEICASMDSGATTSAKYYVSGEITEIYNTTYGNMYITDGTDALTIYGTYDADGTNRFDAMTEKPEAGNTVKLYGKIGAFNGTAQMQYAWIIEVTGVCEHEYEFDCSTNCSICGEGARDVVCVNDGYVCQDGLCIYCGNDVAGLGHTYDDQWDPDCNYGCGETRDVEERPEMTEATITFDADKTQRTEYSTTVQVWENGSLVLTNNKSASTSNVGDYSNPSRFYKSSEIIISYPGMTSLVIDASGIGTNYLWEATLDAAGLTYTVSEKVYTITFAEPVDSITLTAANQARANSITAIAAKQSGEECEHAYDYDCSKNCNICGEETRPEAEHSYFYPCDKVCQICYEETNSDATHNIVAVEAVEATCTENGNIAYWYCSDCGAAWADEALTQITNRFNVIIPAAHTYTDNCDMDCDVCGEYRDAPHNLTTHVEAVVPANCQEEGYNEHWICADCGGYFQDNGWGGYSETNPAWLYYTGEHVRPEGAIACAVVPCELCGEDTYGEPCDRGDAPECTDAPCINCGETVWGWGCNYNTGDEETPLPLCQAGTCVYCGTEYEYLYECENGAWAPCQDGECSYGCGKQYPATANHTLEDCTVDGNCSVCWSYIPAGEHTYDHSEDTECNVCGYVRPVDYMLSNFGGNSVSEDVNGLAFKYTMEVSGVAIKEGTGNVADFTNATAVINSVSEPVKILGMGAIVTNNYSPTLIDYVDGINTIDIPCVYMTDLEADTVTFAVRVINIPDTSKDTDICVRPYLIYEDQLGNVIYWYGLEDWTSYNQIAG